MKLKEAKKLLGQQFSQTVEGFQTPEFCALAFQFIAIENGVKIPYYEPISLGKTVQEAYDNFLLGMEYEPINPEPGEEIPELAAIYATGKKIRFPNLRRKYDQRS